MTVRILFWTQFVSPHMAMLASQLAQVGAQVTYVAQRPMSESRAAQGWQPPELKDVDVCYVATKAEVRTLVDQLAANAIHICEGIRANGMVGVAQAQLTRRGYRFWIVMETVDNDGWRGQVRRALYRWLFWRLGDRLNGALAIGRCTPLWLMARGLPADKIFPFCYFLPVPVQNDFSAAETGDEPIKVLFVGQLIARKRVDLLIEALAPIAKVHPNFVLEIVGAGPLEGILRTDAKKGLQERVQWFGQLSMPDARQHMAEADCLVLPSRHDGWGAVVSEALMAGCPAICSDRCGAAEAVLASGVGGVFPNGDRRALTALLTKHITQGRQTASARATVAQWAQSLGVEAGARYLLAIFSYERNGGVRPSPPWRKIH